MKERGKSVEPEHKNTNFFFSNSNYFSSSSNHSCKKHPFNSSSSVGICPYCLKDKLLDLVCSDCGEQRRSSCSCTDMSSYRNSYCSLDVGSVGRISFLIENDSGDEQKTLLSHMNPIKKSETETEDVVLLKRSSSCVVEAKKRNGLWRFGKLFKKKRGKEGSSERNRNGFDFDQKNEVCVIDVSRSRSLSSYMDGNFEHDDDNGDDSEFIDLEIDLADKSTSKQSVLKKCDAPENERGVKKVKNSHAKAWQGIFKPHSGKKGQNHAIES